MRSVTVLAAALAALVGHANAGCESGWTQVGSACFKRSDSSGTWGAMRSWCQGRGGELASIHSLAELKVASSFGGYRANNWLGGYDWTGAWTDRYTGSREGRWTWSDGSAMDYTRWDGGEPNNCGCGGRGPEHCMHLWVNHGDYQGWNDIWCDASYHGICRKNRIPEPCQAGKYGANQDSGCTNCPAGKYRSSAGATQASDCVSCPAGQYGANAGQTSCSGNCDAGYYTDAGSSNKRQHACPAGRYGSGGSPNSQCSGPSDAGYYTLAGTSNKRQHACPAGKYGNAGASSSSCTGSCNAGYYCPAGSTSPNQNACNGNNYYCPAGSGSRNTVSSGYYSTGGGSTTRSGQTQCQTGYYCSSGVRYSCPAGKYGSSKGLTSASCSGSCSAGYFCAGGNKYGTANGLSGAAATCGSGPFTANPTTAYCPTGTTERKTVSSGYYTTPEGGAVDTRTGQTACPNGYTCANGLRTIDYRWTSGCPGGVTTRTVTENTVADLGDKTVASTIGSPSYSIASVTKGSGCSWPSSGPGITVSSAGQVRVSSSQSRLDFEDCTNFNIVVRASSSGNHIDCAMAVTVINKNEAPSMVTSSCTSRHEVQELSPENTFVGAPVTATDPDRGDALLFSVTGGSGSSLFKVGQCSGQIQVQNSNFKYTDGTSYSLNVQVADEAGATSSCTVTVHVLNINDPPAFPSDTYNWNVNENSAVDTEVGTLAASDPDGDALTYRIKTADNPDNFKIVSNKVKVKTAALNYEQKPRYTYVMEAVDPKGLTGAVTVVIILNDVNDAPTTGSFSATVPELAAVNTAVGSPLEAQDQDSGQTLTWSLSHNTFQISAAGQVSMKCSSCTNYDPPGPSSYTISPVVTDNGSPAKSATATMTIQLSNVNEAPTIASGQSRAIAENTPVGTAVGLELTAGDVDAGTMLAFSIESGNTANAFGVVSSTGQLFVAGALDTETKASYTLGVKVSDGALSASANVAVSITGVNEPPVVTAGQTRSIPENSVPNTNVGAVLTATDPEGDSFTWTMENAGNDVGTFKITSSTGQMQVSNENLLNFEQRTSFTLNVYTTDSKGAKGLSSSVKVDITDVNEPPVFDEYTAQLAVDPNAVVLVKRAIVEGTTTNKPIGNPVTARDPDTGSTPHTVSYSIKSQTPSNGYFSVNSATGQLNTAKTMPSVGGGKITTTVVLTATDSVLSTDINCEVTITDKNDPPVVGDYTRSIAENSAVGAVVGAAIPASDPDAGDTVSYFLTGGNVLNAFAINQVTGQITVAANVLDFEVKPSYTLTVTVEDSREFPLTDTGTITVSLTNVNEPPYTFSETRAVNENTGVNTNVGAVVTTTDPDAGDTQNLAYSITGGNNDGFFKVTSSTGQIQVAKTGLNFEAKPQYALTLKACDNHSPSLCAAGTLTVNINDVNDVPVFGNVPAVRVKEDQSVGDPVGGVVSATDEDGDVLEYSITAGNSAGQFAISSSSGQLSVAKALDFETTTAYTLTIQANDKRGGTPTVQISITILNVNEAPTMAGVSGSVAENSATGTKVGTITAVDQDAGDSMTWSISGGNVGGAFDIVKKTDKTADVVVAGPINYESISSYTLGVTAVDKGGLSVTANFAVTITNVNEAPFLANSDQYVAENSVADVLIGTPLPGMDVDAGAVLTYTIVDGNSGSLFKIVGAQLKVDKAVLDYETRTSYPIKVKVSDQGPPTGGLSHTATITVRVSDVNEPPVVNDATVAIAENSRVNAQCGDPVAASDQDKGQTLNWKITAGNDLGHLKINPCDGQITVAQEAIDYEVLNKYTLTVVVTDDGKVPGPAALSDSATVTVNVLNVNEAPVLNAMSPKVNENSAVNTVIERIPMYEEDGASQAHTYKITRGNDLGYFGIKHIALSDGSPGQAADLIVAKNALNFEHTTSYEIEIMVTDNGTPPLSATRSYTVTVLDVNEAPVVPAATRSVDENTAAGTLVGDPVSDYITDVDAGTWGQMTYSVASNSFFDCNSAGQLSVKTPINYEVNQAITVQVTATDGGSLSTTGSLTVNIGDVNESPNIDPQTRAVNENSPVGANVGAVLAASDPDTLTSQTLAFEILAQTVPGTFGINALTGQLLVAAAVLNYEARSSYQVTVRVTDTGVGRLTDTAIMAISINDLNEAPTIQAGQTRSIPENEPTGTKLGAPIIFNDQDGDTVSLEITGGNQLGHWIIADDGQIQVLAAGLDLEKVPSYSLTITATDPDKASSSAVVAVTLTNVNEAPVFASENFAMSVPENSAAGIKIGRLPAADQDFGAVLTWVFTDSSPRFTLDAETGDVFVKAANVMQKDARYNINCKVTDQGGLSDTAVLVVTVIDTNDPPSITNAAVVRSVAEGSAQGTKVGAAIVATDEENNVITYTIDSGNDDNAFDISAGTGQITVKDPTKLNYEAATFRQIRVVATDNGEGTLSDSKFVTIKIDDVNERPTVPPATFSVLENVPVGTVVNSITASDPDSGDTLTLSIASGNVGGVFKLQQVSTAGAASVGILSVAKAALNFEDLSRYNLNIVAVDKAGLQSADVSIVVNIDDVNDPPVLAAQARNVPENSAVGFLVGEQLPARDEDLAKGVQELSFEITAGNTFDAFSITSSGQITVKTTSALNFEDSARNKYTLSIKVCDNGNPGAALCITTTCTITVLDVNESPFFANALYTGSIDENSAKDTVVVVAGGTLQGGDPEIKYQTLSYSIAGESTAFAIDSKTGVVTQSAAKGGINFEARSSYDLAILVTDSDPTNPLQSSTVLRITIGDVNEAPWWDLTDGAPSYIVNENVGVNTRVTGVTIGKDVDAGLNGVLTYSIQGGSGSTFFTIDENTAVLSVARAELNYEVTSSYALSLRVKDSGGLFAMLDVTVRIGDVNEAPTVADATRSIKENSEKGIAAGIAIPAFDVDFGQQETLAFAIIGGDGRDVFSINSCSGVLTVKDAVLNYEVKNQYTVEISVTDDDTLAPPNLMDTATVTVNILDVNEAPTMDAQARDVDENSAVGVKIGAPLAAADQDRPADALTYSIFSGNDAGLFAIGASDAQLTVAKNKFNFEEQDVYSLVVKVQDEHGLSTTAVITVSVNDVNEAPVLGAAACQIEENSAANTVVCTLVATDVDAGQSLSYAMPAGGNTGTAFAVSTVNDQGVVSVKTAVLDFETKPTYDLTVVVTDNGIVQGVDTKSTLSTTATLKITLIDVNERPTIAAQARSIPENSPAGTTIGAKLTAHDPDGEFLIFSIVEGNDEGLFNITGLDGGQLTVSKPGNFEAKPTYPLKIRVTDTGFPGNALSATAEVVVSLTNVNEAPVFTGATMYVTENSIKGDLIATPVASGGAKALSATDVDVSTNDEAGLRFYFADGSLSDGRFKIDPETGVFTVDDPTCNVYISKNDGVVHTPDSTTCISQKLNFEGAERVITVNMMVNDTHGAKDTGTATFHVVDTNEQPWVVEPGRSYSVVEKSATGTEVFTAAAQDYDTGASPNEAFAALSFSIEGPDAAAFQIDSAKGTVTVKDGTLPVMEFVTGGTNKANITVVVRDGAGSSSGRVFIIDVINNNFAPTMAAQALAVDENKPAGTVVGIVKASDPDDDQTLSYSITSVAPPEAAPLFKITDVATAGTKGEGQISIDSTAGKNLAVEPKLDHETWEKVVITVTATDSGPGNLAVSNQVTVSINDINEAPYFLPIGGTTGRLAVNENSLKDTAVVPRGVAAGGQTKIQTVDVDEQDVDTRGGVGAMTLTIEYSDSADKAAGVPELPFAIRKTDGQVYVKADNTLNFETRSSYPVVITVTDHGGVTATLNTVIDIDNVNEAPVIADQTISVAENRPVGWGIARLNASDVDALRIVTHLSFSIPDPTTAAVSGTTPFGTLFTIEADTGAVRVAETTMDFERDTIYSATVQVTDDGNGGGSTLSDTATVILNIVDVNDVTITGFSLDETSTAPADIATVLHPTVGGQNVYIYGTNFGAKSGGTSPPSGAITVEARYSSKQDTKTVFHATGCTVDRPNTRIKCTTAAGVGRDLVWTVRVFQTKLWEHTADAVGLRTAHIAPVITAVKTDPMPTAGATSVVLEGTNMGDRGLISVVYGPPVGAGGVVVSGADGSIQQIAPLKYKAEKCSISQDHTEITCQSVAGLGHSLQWQATVAQVASPVKDTTTRYADPTVTDLIVVGRNVTKAIMDNGGDGGSGGRLLMTQGLEEVEVIGTNFGPASEVTRLMATYGHTGKEYTATQCSVLKDHTKLKCVSAPGVGAQHKWVITAGGVASAQSTTVTSYFRPAITKVSGPGASEGDTTGKLVLTIAGTNLGAANALLLPRLDYGGADATRYTAAECAVTANHATITCLTVEGTGKDHATRVWVDGQWSDVYSKETISYARPVLINFKAEGSKDANTEGGQVVRIEGRQFGTAVANSIDWIKYGPEDDGIFTAADCSVVVNHTYIDCNTAPGAGAGLKWVVSIDGQTSDVPTTNYRRPSITKITGAGAVDASTDGGQAVKIEGKDFGPANHTAKRGGFLEGVTYGVDGTEYTAVDCAIESHTVINCKTAPGVGKDLKWQVTILGQTSEITKDSPTTNYAAPKVVFSDPSPLHAPTDGGAVMHVNATNLGLKTYRFSPIRTSSLQVLFGGLELDAEKVVSNYRMVDGQGLHSLSFVVPEATAAGRTRSLVINVIDRTGNVQSTPEVTFSYDDPVITEVFRLRNDVLKIVGTSFGVAATGKVQVKATVTSGGVPSDGVDETIDGHTATSYSHSEINVVYSGTAGQVTILRGSDQTSNAVGFEAVVPSISNLDGFAGSGTFFDSEGGDIITVVGYDMGEADKVHTINITLNTQGADGQLADKDCVITNFKNVPGTAIPNTNPVQFTDDQQHVSCRMPSGQGIENKLTVTVRGNKSPPTDVDYEFPWIEKMYTDWPAGSDLSPTSGKHPDGRPVRLTLEGRNFGTAQQSVTLFRCKPMPATTLDPATGVFKATNRFVYEKNCIGDSSIFEFTTRLKNCVFSYVTEGVTQINNGGVVSLASASSSKAVCDMPEGEGMDLFATMDISARGRIITDSPLGQYRHCDLNADGTIKPDATTGQPKCPFTVEYGSVAGNRPHVRYEKPKVTGMVPDTSTITARRLQTAMGTGPTSGNWTIEIKGSDFGRGGPAHADPSAWSAPPASIALGGSIDCVDNPACTGPDRSKCPASAMPCVVCEVFMQTHDSILCNMTEGVGALLPLRVRIAGLVNSAPPLFSFDPPTIDPITNAAMKSGPTSALNSDGSRVPIVLTGNDFGPAVDPWMAAATTSKKYMATVKLLANPADATHQRDIAVPAADIFEWSHRRIAFYLPQGQGRGRTISVSVAGQTPTSTPVKFDYDLPVLEKVEPDTSSVLGEFLPTRGQYNVTIKGKNLGVSGARVVLTHTNPLASSVCKPGDPATKSCSLGANVQTHDRVQFLMPTGIGKDFNLQVFVGSDPSNVLVQSYDAPKITGITPNVADAEGQRIEITGVNFGVEQVGLAIVVAGKNCTDAEFIAGSKIPNTDIIKPPFLRCQLQRDIVGPKELILSVAGQTVKYPDRSLVLQTHCNRNYYGMITEVCLPCPRGAYCDGADAEPVSIAGWWLQNATGPELCPIERLPPLAAATRTHEMPHPDTKVFGNVSICASLVPCEPKAACTGRNLCAKEYRGERCALCSQGYYRRSGECIECPDNPLLLVLGFLVGAIVAIGVGYILNKKSVNLAFISIGVDYFQILAMFANSRVQWPPLIKDIFHLMSVFNFNVEITAPECSIPDLGYITKWAFSEALPLGAGFIFLCTHVGLVFHKAFILRQNKKMRYRHVASMVATYMTLFYYLYLYLTRTTLDIFNCSPTDPSDGFTYLEVVFERCDEPGGIHETLLPYAVLTFLLYSLGYPLTVGTIIYRNAFKIRQDQLLRAKGLGDEKLSNPYALETRKRYHKLYYHFKPDYFFWILVIIGRKFLIAFTALMFNKNPAFQLSMALLVMFVSYSLQVRTKPFMAPSGYEKILQAHKHAAADKPGSVHAQLEEILREVETRGRKTAGKEIRSLEQMEAKLRSNQGVAHSFVTSYNTVEAVLLACAVLVNLAGVMFESGRFESEFYQSQRDAITIGVLLVIFFSLAYFFGVFFLEVQSTLCPKKVKGGDLKTLARQQSRKTGMGKQASFNPLLEAAAAAGPISGPASLRASTSGPSGGQRRVTTTDTTKLKAEIEALRSQNAELSDRTRTLTKAQQMASVTGATTGAAAAFKRGVRGAGAGARGPAKTKKEFSSARARRMTQRKGSGGGGVEMGAVSGAGGGGGGGAGDWETRHTDDGTPYYLNIMTGESVWQKPAGV